MTILRNTLADLAEQVKATNAEMEKAEATVFSRALETGALLLKAKTVCAHGEWLPFLERAAIGERQAQRLMQLGRSGLTSDTVSDLGGMKAALAFLTGWRVPAYDDALLITSADRQREFDAGADWTPGAAAYVWESDRHRGHYYIAALDNRDLISITKRPMQALIEIEGQPAVSTVLYWLRQNFEVPMNDWHIDLVGRHVPEIVIPDRVLRDIIREYADKPAVGA